MCPLLEFKTKVGVSALPIGSISAITGNEPYEHNGETVETCDLHTFDGSRHTSIEPVTKLVQRFNNLVAAYREIT